MRLNRRQLGLLTGALAVEWAAGCASGQKAVTQSAGTANGSPVPTAAVKPLPGVPQALRSDAARGASGSPKAAGGTLNGFGASLLALLPADANAVLSPYSIYAVLAMARVGARGATAAQLDAVLGSQSVQAGSMTAVDAAISAALAAGKPPAGGDPSETDMRPVSIDIANSVWSQPGLGVHPAYLDELAAGFGVGMYELDFAADPEAARRAINAWVSQHTGGLITELIARGVVDADTVLALVNAMRLSAPWQDHLSATDSLPFAAPTGSVLAAGMGLTGVVMMNSGPGWSAVTLPYRGNGLAMTVVLPDAGSFANVRARLGSTMEAAVSGGTADGVQVTMPTFKSGSHLSLKTAVEQLGVVALFDDNAVDLSGIAGVPGYLFATDLVHQSVITVDEKGTEAAAATALLVSAASGMAAAKTFTVSRPFFYSVHDTVTGAPLFLGQVTDPTK